MCNLSDGVEQIGFEKGMKQGLAQSPKLLIMNLFKHNFTIEEVCTYTGCDKEFMLKVKEKLHRKRSVQ